MITLWEHFGLFAILVLLVTLVYSGLRQDDLRIITRLALKRFVYFLTGSAALAVAIYFFALAL